MPKRVREAAEEKKQKQESDDTKTVTASSSTTTPSVRKEKIEATSDICVATQETLGSQPSPKAEKRHPDGLDGGGGGESEGPECSQDTEPLAAGLKEGSIDAAKFVQKGIEASGDDLKALLGDLFGDADAELDEFTKLAEGYKM